MKKANIFFGAVAVATAAAAYIFYQTSDEFNLKENTVSSDFKPSTSDTDASDNVYNTEVAATTVPSSASVTKEVIKSILNIPDAPSKDYSIIYLDKEKN